MSEALEAELLRVAVRAAEQVAPGRVDVVRDAGSWSDLPPRLNVLVTQSFDAGARAVVLVWPGVPRLRPDVATAAVSDLAAGCDLVLGPMIQGGLYLMALREPHPELFALPGEAWLSEDVMAFAGAARDMGLELGILQAERALRSPADVRAALADPLLPDDLRRLLSEFVPGSRHFVE